jgi:hypothetical protein
MAGRLRDVKQTIRHLRTRLGPQRIARLFILAGYTFDQRALQLQTCTTIILASQDVRIRIGTAFTRSREDRFSNRDQTSPENTSLYNSDGVLAFSTGATCRGVTIDQATYRMWAADAGIK